MTLRERLLVALLELGGSSFGLELATRVGVQSTDVYAPLHALEARAFVRSTLRERRRVYTLTSRGRAEAISAGGRTAACGPTRRPTAARR